MKKKLLFLTSACLIAQSSNAQWVEQNAGFTNQTLGFYEISIVDENVVWAICYDGVGGLFGPDPVLEYTRTTDGGTTWMPGLMGSDSTLAFSNICALSASEAWVTMHKRDFSGGGGVFHTTDGGTTWEQINPGELFDDNSFPNFVYFKDELTGVAAGDANGGYFEIYTTGDGGITWTRTPQTNVPDFVPGGGYGWFDGFAVLGDTVWFGTNGGQMYKSTDFGMTWAVSTVSPAGHTVYEITFNDDGQRGLTHVRSNSATMLFSTTDGGLTWTQLPSHPNWKQSKITTVPGTDLFVSTSVINSNRGSAYTDDLGITWYEIEDQTPKAACRFLNSTTGWAGGFFNDVPGSTLSGGIYKWDDSMALSIIEDISSEVMIKAYPNPSSGIVNFTHALPTDISGATLQVRDAIGNTIYQTDIKPHSGTTQIDLTTLPIGLYLYILHDTHGSVQTGKLIKE